MERDLVELNNKVARLYEIVAEHKEDMTYIMDRLNLQYELSQSIALMAQSMQQLQKDVQEVKTEVLNVKKDMRHIQDKDSESWDKFKWVVITSITSGIIGILVGNLFLR